MVEWATRLAQSLGEGPAAMVTILATEGSTPRGPGTRMIVTAGGQQGTIGGGRLEHEVSRQAHAVLTLPPGTWRIQDYPLGPLLGQCCGGQVRLLIEHVDPRDIGWIGGVVAGRMLVSMFEETNIQHSVEDNATASRPLARGSRPAAGSVLAERLGEERRPVYLFGAGHVGSALAAALAPLPFTLAWFDTREEQAAVAGAVYVSVEDLATCVAAAPRDAAILVLTHDHALDYALTAAALTKGAAFVGLIGSATKRARFLSRFRQDGIDADRLVCPIGLPGIEGKEPEVIAAATAAQLLTLRPDAR